MLWKVLAEIHSPKAKLKLEGNLLVNIFSFFFLKYLRARCILQNHITRFRSWVVFPGFYFCSYVLVKPGSLNTECSAIGIPSLHDGRGTCTIQRNTFIQLKSWRSHFPEHLLSWDCRNPSGKWRGTKQAVWGEKSSYRCAGTGSQTAAFVRTLKCWCSAGNCQHRDRTHPSFWQPSCFCRVRQGFLNTASFLEYIFICSIKRIHSIEPLRLVSNSPRYIHLFQWTNNVFVYSLTVLPVTNGTHV